MLDRRLYRGRDRRLDLLSTDPAVQDILPFLGRHPSDRGGCILLVADAALSAMGLPVPEPSTWAMMAIGFLGLGFAGYRHSASGRAAG